MKKPLDAPKEIEPCRSSSDWPRGLKGRCVEAERPHAVSCFSFHAWTPGSLHKKRYGFGYVENPLGLPSHRCKRLRVALQYDHSLVIDTGPVLSFSKAFLRSVRPWCIL